MQGNANSRQPGPSTATAAASSWQTLWGATPSWASNTGQFALSSIRCLQLCDAPSCITQMHAITLLSPHFCSVCCHLVGALCDSCPVHAGAYASRRLECKNQTLPSANQVSGHVVALACLLVACSEDPLWLMCMLSSDCREA